MKITSTPQNLPPRIVLLGTEKIGKTTFSCGSRIENESVAEVGLNAPVVISVDGEEGADALPVARFDTAKSFQEVMQDLRDLAKEPHDFRTVVLDSASALEPLIWSKVIEEDDRHPKNIEGVGGGFGKGYIAALDKWRQLCAGLDYLRKEKGMASIIIGHAKIKSINTPDTEPFDSYVFDLNDKAANLLYRWADLILFATTKTFVRGGDKNGAHGRGYDSGERYLYTQKRATHPGGGRGSYSRIPYELPLSWNEFDKAVKAATNNPANH